MTLQVLPPELMEAPKDKIETKENLYWKPSSLKDGESEEFRLLGCYETGHSVVGWQYASECRDPKTGSFVLMATLLLVLILEHRTIWLERPTGPNQTDLRSTAATSNPAGSWPGWLLVPHEADWKCSSLSRNPCVTS